MTQPESVRGVLDVMVVRGSASRSTPDLLIEIPHGATQTSDFLEVERRLTSPLPERLSDFFHVNTDAGAPELAVAVAQEFVQVFPSKSVVLLRCRIPRTFIDCNRQIDASPEEFREGKVTPGLMPWVVTSEDRQFLLSRYRQYVDGVRQAAELVMANSGAMLLLHTYAPRSVGVEVDLNIVSSLHDAYRPEKERTWPLRPEIDVIGRTLEGELLAPLGVVQALENELGHIGLPLAQGVSYPIHPSTVAHAHVTRWPNRTLCLEVRRDLLADPWEPFAQMSISPSKSARLGRTLAKALSAWW